MINKDMSETKPIKDDKKKDTTVKPNEISGIYFSSSVKIFDPNTLEVLVQKRGDN